MCNPRLMEAQWNEGPTFLIDCLAHHGFHSQGHLMTQQMAVVLAITSSFQDAGRKRRKERA